MRRLGRLDDDHLDRIDLDRLLAGGVGLPADTFDAALRRAVEAAEPDPGVDERTRARTASEARHWFNPRTGMGHLSAKLDPERYEAVANALDQHTASLANAAGDGVEKNANLVAEALVDLICSSGERQPQAAHVTVVVDEATLNRGRHPGTIAETGDGHPLTDDALARLVCGGVLQRVVFDAAGLPVDVGRRVRTATAAQRAMLRAMHPTCAWVGCHRPVSQCEAHHIDHWQNGGRTDLQNMLPLCSHHHHLVHDGRWTIELLEDRRLRITRPDGVVHATTSQPTRRPPPEHGSPPLDRHCILTTE